MSRINDLRQKYGGQNPSEIKAEILQEMLEVPYQGGDIEERTRASIRRPNGRGTLNSAVRCKCLDCVGWVQSEVLACVSVRCPLWPFRMGDNPFRQKRTISDKHLAKLHGRAGEAD